mmetsp:Transcript_16944/g.43353  ORF Transcript_16944/g.43353 Transcript_16944/m.43353 type:complete len:401 (-) Transcript_16944:515-1717(-)
MKPPATIARPSETPLPAADAASPRPCAAAIVPLATPRPTASTAPSAPPAMVAVPPSSPPTSSSPAPISCRASPCTMAEATPATPPTTPPTICPLPDASPVATDVTPAPAPPSTSRAAPVAPVTSPAAGPRRAANLSIPPRTLSPAPPMPTARELALVPTPAVSVLAPVRTVVMNSRGEPLDAPTATPEAVAVMASISPPALSCAPDMRARTPLVTPEASSAPGRNWPAPLITQSSRSSEWPTSMSVDASGTSKMARTAATEEQASVLKTTPLSHAISARPGGPLSSSRSRYSSRSRMLGRTLRAPSVVLLVLSCTAMDASAMRTSCSTTSLALCTCSARACSACASAVATAVAGAGSVVGRGSAVDWLGPAMEFARRCTLVSEKEVLYATKRASMPSTTT